MVSGSAALALKAAALFSVIALLVVPSLGRCGHSPPPPPPPVASTPPPLISCDDCYSQCSTQCDAYIREKCVEYCDVEGKCNSCMTKVMEDCKAKGTCTGSCDCSRSANRTCTNDCTAGLCDACKSYPGETCWYDCSEQCSAPNCIPPPPAPAPTPAPAPAPAPMIPCDDCRSQCQSTCGAFVHENCSIFCGVVEDRNCYKDCKVAVCKFLQECYNADTCDCLDAGDTQESSDGPCTSQCSTEHCDTCKVEQGQQCSSDCNKECSAPNCIPSSPPEN